MDEFKFSLAFANNPKRTSQLWLFVAGLLRGNCCSTEMCVIGQETFETVL